HKIKGTMPSGQFWEIYKAIIAADGIIQRVIVMPPGAPQAAVDALRTAIARVNGDAAYADEAEKTFGFVPQWAGGPDTPEVAQSAWRVPPGDGASGPDNKKTRRRGAPGGGRGGAPRRSLANFPPRLRLYIERHRRSRAHGFEPAPQRRHEIAGALDLLAAPAA